MTEKTKKRLTIAAVSVLGLALLVAIGMQFAKAPDKPDTLPQTEQGSSSVTPEVQPPEVVVTPPNNTPSQPVETLPPQTDLPEQKLQPDPVKPEAPAKPELPKDADTTNPSKPPEYRPEDTEKKPAAESKPQGGGGLPGFDNVPDGGANQGEYVDGDGDINKQVGEMD